MKKSKLIAGLLVSVIALAQIIPTTIFAADTPVKSSVKSKLTVLEIQPGPNYRLQEDTLEAQLNADVSLVQMPMGQAIATTENINGKYDIVYIGDGKNQQGQYRNATIEGISYPVRYSTSKADYNKQKLAGNDITQLKIKQLVKALNANQVIVCDKGILDSTADGTNIQTFVKDNRTKILVNEQNTMNYAALRDRVGKATILPGIHTSEAKVEDSMFLIQFRAHYPDNRINTMKANLYIDINGDSIYTDNELLGSLNNISNYENYDSIDNWQLINQELDYTFKVDVRNIVDFISWKIELVDATSNLVSYTTGSIEKQPLTNKEIKVLQVYPDITKLPYKDDAQKNKALNYYKGKSGLTNTLNLKTDLESLMGEVNKKGFSLNIETIWLRGNEKEPGFLERYKDPNYSINGKYDMIIFGFADGYGNPWFPNSAFYRDGDIYGAFDITDEKVIDDIKEFIKSKQSVMFVHDTMSKSINNKLWTEKLTTNFKSQLGQLDKATDFVTLGKDGSKTTRQAREINSGQITQYPFKLSQNSSTPINVADTHFQYYKLNLEDEETVVWYNLTGNGYDGYDAANNYYTYSIGNLTYSGTAHSTPNEIEKKMFINTMVKASTAANHAPKLELLDIKNNENIAKDIDTIKFSIKAKDLDSWDKEIKYMVNIYTKGSTQPIYTRSTESDNKQIPNGSIINLEIPRNIIEEILKTGKEFTLSSSVEDSQGAKSETIDLNLNLVEKPLYTKYAHNLNGYLVGDTLNTGTILDSKFKEETYGTESILQNIKIGTQLVDSKDNTVMDLTNTKNLNVKVGTNSQLKDKNTISFNDSAILKTFEKAHKEITKSAEYGYSINLQQAGDYKLSTALSYDLVNKVTNRKQSQKDSVEKSILVKKSKVDIQVIDKLSRPVKNAEISFKREGGTIKLDTVAKTDMYGNYSIEGLPTGNYTVQVTPDKSYMSKGTAEFALSYDKENVTLVIEIEGTPVKGVEVQLKAKETSPLKKDLYVDELADTAYLSFSFNNLEEFYYEKFRLLQQDKEGVDLVKSNYYPLALQNVYSLDTHREIKGFTWNDANKELIYDGDKLSTGNYEATFKVSLPTISEDKYKQAMYKRRLVSDKVVSIMAEKNAKQYSYAIPESIGTITRDSTPPTIKEDYLPKMILDKKWIAKDGIDLLLRVDGTGSKVEEVKYLKGKENLEAFKVGGTSLTFKDDIYATLVKKENNDIWKNYEMSKDEGEFVVWAELKEMSKDGTTVRGKLLQDGPYTFYARDEAGVETIYLVDIQLPLLPDIN